MKHKLLNVMWFVLLSTCLASNANAALIVGENYTDSSGVQWEYLGEFDLAEGADHFSVATPLNGLEAAASIFGGSIADLATAAFDLQFDVGSINAGDNIVNHLAWYDGSAAAVARFAEDVVADANNDGNYTFGIDVSAYVDDRAFYGDYTNYAFTRATVVSEPSTLILFSLALMGFAARRARK